MQDNAGTRRLWEHQVSVTVGLWQVALILWSLRVRGITSSLVMQGEVHGEDLLSQTSSQSGVKPEGG